MDDMADNTNTPEKQKLPKGCQLVDNRDQSRRWWGGGLRPIMGANYLVIDDCNNVCGYGGTPSEAVECFNQRRLTRSLGHPQIVLHKGLITKRPITVLLHRVGTVLRRAFGRTPPPPSEPVEKRVVIVLSRTYRLNGHGGGT
jgi:hypothetical protein